MVREPKVFLFDEPLSNLDAALRVQMRIEISKLHKRLQSTMIYVTHDQVEAMTMADKIVALDHGVVAQVGRPLELYHYPANKFVAGFIGSPKMNFIDVQVRSANSQNVTVSLPGAVELTIPVNGEGLQSGDKATLGIRPEHFVEREQADIVLNGMVSVVERLGYQTLLHTEVEGFDSTLTVRTHGSNPVRESEAIALGVQAQHCHLFKEDTSACPRLFREPSVDF